MGSMLPQADRVLGELVDQLARGEAVPPEVLADLLGVTPGTLCQASYTAFPLSHPDDAVQLTSRELLASLRAESAGAGVAPALRRLMSTTDPAATLWRLLQKRQAALS